jgi:hypothetical protein
MTDGRAAVVLRPSVAAWDPRPAREPGATKKRRAREALVALVSARYGVEASAAAEALAVAASWEEIQLWTRRAHYQPSWEAVLEGRPLRGVRLVSLEDLFAAAIGNPLETWCLRAYFTSRGDELRDTETILWEAPWLRENSFLVGGLIADLQSYRTALLSCESECLARDLQAAVTSKWLWFTLYNPAGAVTG